MFLLSAMIQVVMIEHKW